MMITLVCCSCYFDLMLYMKNKLPQVFRDAISGCLKSVGKITDMREKEKKCIDFTEIQNDSVIIVCLNCLQYQIQLTDRKRFINILLEGECFNFKENHTCFVLTHFVEKLFQQTKCVGVVYHNAAKYFYSMTFTDSF